MQGAAAGRRVRREPAPAAPAASRRPRVSRPTLTRALAADPGAAADALAAAAPTLSHHVALLADAAAAAAGGRQDGGWLAPLSDSLEASLLFFRDAFRAAGVPYSYGWAVIALTAATKVVTFPFTKAQVESALAVQKVKPEVDDIKRAYAGDKDAIQRETAALYEAAGVNPSAGCAPTLATLPVFWGLYRALSNVSADGIAEGFYWIPSLSGPTTIAAQRAGTGTAWLLPLVDGAPPGGWDGAVPYLILPVALVLAQWASSAIISPTPTANDEDANSGGALFGKALMVGLPVMVGWFALNVPAGLSLYYMANTVMTSAVQVWLRKLGGATAFEWQQEIGVGQARRDGPVGELPAAWLLEFDTAPLTRMEAGGGEEAAAAAAALASADPDAAAAAAALAALPVVARSKRRREGGLPEGAAGAEGEKARAEEKLEPMAAA